jgi:ATP-binding cassette, subfamily B, bacterial PglK
MYRNLKQALDLIHPDQHIRLAATLAVMIATALLQVAGVVSVMPFIALVADPSIAQQNPWLAPVYERFGFEGPHQFLVALGVGVIVLLVVTNAFSAFGRWVTLRFVWDTHHLLSHRLLSAYLNEPYDFFLTRNTSELSKSLLSEVREVIDGIVLPWLDVISKGLLTVCLLGLLMFVDPLLALVAGGTLGGAYAGIYLLVRNKQQLLGERRHVAFGDRFWIAGEAFGGIKDVKVMGSERYFLSRFEETSVRYSRATTSSTVIEELPRYALETLAFCGIIVTIIYLLETRDSLGSVLPLIALYAMAGYRLLPALQAIFASLSGIRFHTPALITLHRDLFHGSRTAEMHRSGAAGAARGLRPLRREIRMCDVEFRYPGAAQPSLRRVNLVIPRDSSIGLIGPTGSGKTTLVDLLLGLFSPTAGTILIDGVPLTEDDMAAWRRNVGYVSQSVFLSDSSISQNIAFGIPEAEIDRTAVERAARSARLHELVERLPDGYDTVVGERGVRFSGGERQRVAIARALYRDPDVLVMDEATSALDSVTEEAVMQAVRDLSGHKTLILIAHRLTTVRDCDTIYLLEEGSVSAQGTFSELVADSEMFRAMARQPASAS